jgi:NitT/TauT family transport system substrate-binding protein
MAFGIKSVNPIIINILIAEQLGYTKQEGLQFTPVAVGTNSNAQIAVDKGDVEFAVGTPSFQFPLFAKGQLPPIVNYYEYTYPYKWDVAVKPESGIQKYEDLKGKKIGVSDLGTTDYPVTRAVLKNIGIDPDKDVSWTAVGAGVSAGVALQRGVIDALAYFDTGFGQIDAAGIPIRMLPRPANVPLVGGLFISAMSKFIKDNHKVCVGFARAVNKASEYLLTNPEAGARAFLKLYPETAPRGASEADAVKSILFAAKRRIPLYRPPYPNTKMGFIREEELITDAKFQGLDIKDLKPIYTNDLVDEINNYDRNKIIAEAKAAKI